MKTNGILGAIALAIIAKIEAVNAPKKEEKGKQEIKVDPRQEALDNLFSKPDAFGGYRDQVAVLTEAITGLKINVALNKATDRYVVVVPINNSTTGHYHTLNKPAVSITKEGHAFSLSDRIDSVYKEEARAATEEEAKAFIAELKADIESDSSKLIAWLSRFNVKSLAE